MILLRVLVHARRQGADSPFPAEELLGTNMTDAQYLLGYVRSSARRSRHPERSAT